MSEVAPSIAFTARGELRDCARDASASTGLVTKSRLRPYPRATLPNARVIAQTRFVRGATVHTSWCLLKHQEFVDRQSPLLCLELMSMNTLSGNSWRKTNNTVWNDDCQIFQTFPPHWVNVVEFLKILACQEITQSHWSAYIHEIVINKAITHHFVVTCSPFSARGAIGRRNFDRNEFHSMSNFILQLIRSRPARQVTDTEATTPNKRPSICLLHKLCLNWV